MDSRITDFVDGIKGGSLDLVRGELKGFLGGLKDRTDTFSQQQRGKIEKYLLQLALGQITKQQCQDMMEDIAELAAMEVRLEKVTTKAAAQRIQEGVTSLVINGLIKAIPG
jgi:hypothetical protein